MNTANEFFHQIEFNTHPCAHIHVKNPMNTDLPDFLDKFQILSLDQVMYIINLKYSVIPEDKKNFQDY